MRIASFLGITYSLVSAITAVSSSATEGSKDIQVLATAAFPETNAFNHVINGEKNTLTVTIENKSGQNVTLLTVAGSLSLPDTDTLFKNLTSLKYGVPLIDNVKIEIPYTFYSEYKPGDHRLNIWLELSAGDAKYKVEAYDSVITIVEPNFTIFDFKLVTTYLMVAAIFGGIAYIAYQSFAPQPKRKSKPAATSVSAPVGVVTATGSGGYQEEWIPEHHLKKPKSAKKAGFASGTSGDELSGGDVSPTEGKRRKGKK